MMAKEPGFTLFFFPVMFVNLSVIFILIGSVIKQFKPQAGF